MTNKKPTKADIAEIKRLYFAFVEPQSAKSESSTATNSAVDENVVKMHKTEKGNLSQRGKIPTALFNIIIEGDKDTKILKSFPKMVNGQQVMYGEKKQYINFVPEEHIGRFEAEAKKLGITVEYV